MNPQQDEPKQELEVVRVPDGAKAVTKFTAEHGREVGLPSPEAINYMMSVAKLLLDSSLITNDMGQTAEQVRANALAKMLVGHELHMQPMEALQDVDIVKGKIFIRYPQLINQLLLRGFTIKWLERSNTRAALRVTPKSGMEPEDFEFTIEDAKMAGLTAPSQRTGAPSQFVLRPRVMLTARVVSEAYRSTGGRSNVYAPEEKAEILAIESGDASNGAFAAEGKRQAEENPYFIKKSSSPGTSDSGAAAGEGNVTPSPSSGTGSSKQHTAMDVTGGEPSFVRWILNPNLQTAAAEPSTQSAAVAVEETTKATGSPAPESRNAEPSQGEMVKEFDRSSTQYTLVPPSGISVLLDIQRLIPDDKLREKITKSFLRGYLGVRKVPGSDPQMSAAFTLLRAVAEKSPALLTQDPEGVGLSAGAGWRGLDKYTEAWPEDCRGLARAIALDRYPDSGGGDLVGYFEDPVEIQKFSVPELRTFLQVLSRTRKAVALKDLAEETGKSMSEIVLSWGMDLEECTEKEILARLGAEAFRNAGKPVGLFDVGISGT